MTKEAREFLAKIYKDNNLTPDDVFTKTMKSKDGSSKTFTIVTRQGIDKVMKNLNINISYTVEAAAIDFCIVKARAWYRDIPDDVIESLGSSCPENSRVTYYAEMAEKRAKARSVLTLVGLYQYGVFGEDEAKDFER